MRKLTSLLTIVLFVQLSAVSQTLDEKLKEIDDYANTVISAWKDSGAGMAIAVVKDDKVVFQNGYGVRAIGSSPATAYAPAFLCRQE